MTGHHEVRAFHFTLHQLETQPGISLPPAWKPFSSNVSPGGIWIIARRWVRGKD